MKDEMVQVTVQVPKGIDNFVRKIADLDDSTPQEWYQYWIQQEFNAIADDNFNVHGLNAENMKQMYHYERQ
jgi:hypothetical protein